MPRGKYVNHKGRSRNLTSPEELEEEMKKDSQKSSIAKESAVSGSENEVSTSNSESGSESEVDTDDDKKANGVSNLMEIENPNRVHRRTAIKPVKVENVEKTSKSELSRREREELERQRAQATYQKLHAEGKTEQARVDLARSAIIKQHRAEPQQHDVKLKKEKEERKNFVDWQSIVHDFVRIIS